MADAFQFEHLRSLMTFTDSEDPEGFMDIEPSGDSGDVELHNGNFKIGLKAKARLLHSHRPVAFSPVGMDALQLCTVTKQPTSPQSLGTKLHLAFTDSKVLRRRLAASLPSPDSRRPTMSLSAWQNRTDASGERYAMNASVDGGGSGPVVMGLGFCIAVDTNECDSVGPTQSSSPSEVSEATGFVESIPLTPLASMSHIKCVRFMLPSEERPAHLALPKTPKGIVMARPIDHRPHLCGAGVNARLLRRASSGVSLRCSEKKSHVDGPCSPEPEGIPQGESN
eukprot:GGOE01053876.1.p1 GENE.GGOE01053876.1~~GGOE01053876.1.p1  ORF type:complete len:292 (-),score=44.90 GGOE01053876.1:671-1513(-)